MSHPLSSRAATAPMWPTWAETWRTVCPDWKYFDVYERNEGRRRGCSRQITFLSAPLLKITLNVFMRKFLIELIYCGWELVCLCLNNKSTIALLRWTNVQKPHLYLMRRISAATDSNECQELDCWLSWDNASLCWDDGYMIKYWILFVSNM